MGKFINNANSSYTDNLNYSEDYADDIFDIAAYDADDKIADEELFAELDKLAYLEDEIRILEAEQKMKKKHKLVIAGLVGVAGFIVTAAAIICRKFRKMLINV